MAPQEQVVHLCGANEEESKPRENVSHVGEVAREGD